MEIYCGLRAIHLIYRQRGDNLLGLSILANGDILISGSTNSFGIGVPIMFGIAPVGLIMRLSENGEFIWAKGVRYTQVVREAIEINTGDIIAFGGDLDQRTLVYKMSPEGDIIWSKKMYQEVATDLFQMTDVIETADDNYLFNGGK